MSRKKQRSETMCIRKHRRRLENYSHRLWFAYDMNEGIQYEESGVTPEAAVANFKLSRQLRDNYRRL